MCKEATNCELTERVNELGNEMADVKSRLSKVETGMDSMRNETRDGFQASREDMKQVASAVNALGHDFGSRMTMMESRIVTEKEKWGETLRWTVKVIIRVLCALALAAGGITVCKLFFAH
jgi:hypothetical protein